MRNALSSQTLHSVYAHLARRYDIQHALLTFKTDQKGRKLIVDKCVQEGKRILDCGAGTGSTGILAAKKAGAGGQVTLFDLSEDMLGVAKQRVARENLSQQVDYKVGDMVNLPFEDNRFDVVLSTYSLCPIYDPAKGALEMYRVTKPGGKLGIGHSTEPQNKMVKFIADRIENLAWHFPWLSMGCRSIEVLPVLEKAGGRVLFQKHIGFPLWPFLIAVIEKPR